MSYKIKITVLWLIYTCNIFGNTEVLQDTYINALHDSHQGGYTDSNTSEGYEYNNKYLPPATSPPNYIPEKPIYGPPIYHHPAIAPIYGLPEMHHPHITHRGNWILEKLKTKINLFAIGKIVLKLLIFKKIVKFIGIICLLLFLPKLKELFKDNMNMDTEDERMKSLLPLSEYENLERQLSNLINTVESGFIKYNQ